MEWYSVKAQGQLYLLHIVIKHHCNRNLQDRSSGKRYNISKLEHQK